MHAVVFAVCPNGPASVAVCLFLFLFVLLWRTTPMVSTLETTRRRPSHAKSARFLGFWFISQACCRVWLAAGRSVCVQGAGISAAAACLCPWLMHAPHGQERLACALPVRQAELQPFHGWGATASAPTRATRRARRIVPGWRARCWGGRRSCTTHATRSS